MKGLLAFYVILSFAVTFVKNNVYEGFKKKKKKKKTTTQTGSTSSSGSATSSSVSNTALKDMEDKLDSLAKVINNYESSYFKQILSNVTQVKKNTSEL
jgi:hypothetical protein